MESLFFSGTQHPLENVSAQITPILFIKPLPGREAESEVGISGGTEGKTFPTAGKTHPARDSDIGTITVTFRRETAEKFQYAIAFIKEAIEDRCNDT